MFAPFWAAGAEVGRRAEVDRDGLADLRARGVQRHDRRLRLGGAQHPDAVVARADVARVGAGRGRLHGPGRRVHPADAAVAVERPGRPVSVGDAVRARPDLRRREHVERARHLVRLGGRPRPRRRRPRERRQRAQHHPADHRPPHRAHRAHLPVQ